jgi:hypothetical protein
MILLVTIITSSAVFASSLITKYTICRSAASLFWKSFEMPKKREVASLVGNFSPVNSSREIFVRRIRHFRGETGDVLKTRATIIPTPGQRIAVEEIPCNSNAYLPGRPMFGQP